MGVEQKEEGRVGGFGIPVPPAGSAFAGCSGVC